MKKLFCILLMALFLASPVWGSDLKSVGNTADAVITTGSGYLRSIIVNTDGTNAVTVSVYDNATAASGNKVFSTIIATTSAANRVTTLWFSPQECPYFNGMYVDITTSGSVTYDVFFDSR